MSQQRDLPSGGHHGRTAGKSGFCTRPARGREYGEIHDGRQRHPRIPPTGDLVYRTTGEFQQFPRLADTKMLDIFDRFHTGGGLEAAKEGSLLKPGMCGHIGDTGRPPGARLQPVLYLQDRLVAMRQPRRKTAVMSLLPTGGSISRNLPVSIITEGPSSRSTMRRPRSVHAISPPAVMISPSSMTILSISVRISGKRSRNRSANSQWVVAGRPAKDLSQRR